jgi:hypothetical protein
MRIACFGDVGGHLEPFTSGLQALGADTDGGTLPDDLIVIQVGDLIRKGPDSDGVVTLVDRFRQHSTRQWVQLIGNHEAHYLGGPRFWQEKHISDTTIAPSATGPTPAGRASRSACGPTTTNPSSSPTPD